MDPEELERLVAEYRRRMARAWQQALDAMRDIPLDELEQFMATGNIAAAMAMFDSGMMPLSNVWNQAFGEAATRTAANLSEALGGAGRGTINVSYDMVNEGAVRAMRENQLRLVREFSEAQRRATQQVLIDGVRDGANPREQARDFRRSIGLTQRQQAAVGNFRRLLQQNDPEALTRALRDKRHDRTVRRAIREGRPLSQRQVDTMVNRYRERYLKYRSEVIARTEAMRAVHEGQERMMRQAVENGIVQNDQLVREWNTALNGRVRSFENTSGKTSHSTMHGQLRRGLDEPFLSGSGSALRYPTDPNAPAFDTVQCRCTVSFRMDLDVSAVTGGARMIG